jgi:hypothetical protein
MKAVTATIWSTMFLLALYVVCTYSSSPELNGLLYFSVPVVLIAMVFIILKDNSIKSKQLGKDEWGYADKDKDELWII